MAEGGYDLVEFVRHLRVIATETRDPGAITQRLQPLVRALALDRTWLEPSTTPGTRHRGSGCTFSTRSPITRLLVFAAAWLPGRGALPHNHGTWAVVAGVDGLERNIFWRRMDDGSRPGYAKIRRRPKRCSVQGTSSSSCPMRFTVS